MITDEMVEKAFETLEVHMDVDAASREHMLGVLRVVLEAVAPALIAQGLEEAADMVKNDPVLGPMGWRGSRFLARAQKLRGQGPDPQ